MCLLDLPVELLAEALAYLDHLELLRIRRTNRTLRDAVDHTASLSYKLDLSKHGMQDGTRADLGSADRLERLRSYRKAWHALEWSANKKIPDGGVFAIAGDIVACTRRADTDKITFIRPGSNIRGVNEHQWTIPAPPGLRDFIIEPTMDLIVVLVHRVDTLFELHLLSMSTGQNHPRAACPVLSVPLAFVPADFKPMVMEDRLGILFTSDGLIQSLFTVWDWHTGEKFKSPFRKRHVPCVAFLDRNLVVMPFTYNDNNTFSSTALLVADISVPTKSRRICRLLLPRSAVSTIAFADFIWDQPLSRRMKDASPGWFAPAPRDRILGLSVAAFDAVNLNNMHHTSAMFIMSVPRVVDCIRQRTIPPNVSRCTIEWDAWGPHSTRIFAHDCPSLWLSFIHGTRYAVLDDGDAKAGYTVYDFGKTAVGDEDDPAGEGAVITEPSIYDAREAFSAPVKTCLPYRAVQRRLEPEVADWIGSPDSTGSAAVMLIDDGVVFSPEAGGEYWAWTL
ncbi:hypothetical protein BD626DRAFT_580024 [Schizophyllum amplum]|uniref:F-box domain-containing protein n=1 Tax=Schizophyllum amplum TaxID=97359 RepID=A0A550CXR4_9AGAR|nr:hypothetical protein BD626DRAFT_580024 [Auriculariopsis ampla]